MALPVVSILMPVFNAGSTLPACVRSIRRQTETRWECIVVNDGSSDSTLACARRWAETDGRVLVLDTPHRGIVDALNTGLERCRGTFVARMDADDLMHRHRLAAQIAALERSSWAAAGCRVRLFPRTVLTPRRRAYEGWLNSLESPARVRADAFVECPIAHPALMIRTDILKTFGYRDQGWPEDYDLVLRLLAAGFEIGIVPRRLLCWRDGATRLSRTHPMYALDRFTACKAAFLATGLLVGTDEYVLWGYGQTGRALRRALLRHRKRPACIVEVHRGRLGNSIHGVPVIAPAALSNLRGQRIVASVAGGGPRAQIRAALHAVGFEESQDFVCAA